MARFQGIGLSCGTFPSHDIGEKIFGGENTIFPEKNGVAIRDGLMKELGLGTPVIAWYAARDRLAEICADLCILTNSLGRIGNEVYNASRTEVNEYAEGFRMGKVGSSTMPHKRNPFQSGRIVAYSRLSRGIMADAVSFSEIESPSLPVRRGSLSLLRERKSNLVRIQQARRPSRRIRWWRSAS